MDVYINGIKAKEFGIETRRNVRKWRSSWWDAPGVIHEEVLPDLLFGTVWVDAIFELGELVTIKATCPEHEMQDDFYITSIESRHSIGGGLFLYQLEGANNIT